MHDFENVLSYKMDQRRRRGPPRPPSPAKPAKHQALEPAAPGQGPARKAHPAKPRPSAPHSPEVRYVKKPNESAEAQQGKSLSEGQAISDNSQHASTACHPLPPAAATTLPPPTEKADKAVPMDVVPAHVDSAVVTKPAAAPQIKQQEVSEDATIEALEEPITTTVAPSADSPPISMPAATVPVVVAPPTATRGTFTTPAPHRKGMQTPASRPSTSRNHAALSDGQFQPTPMDTPATVVGNLPSRFAPIPFRSPPPRTVFAMKKARRTEVEARPGASTAVMEVVPPPAIAAPVAATTTTVPTSATILAAGPQPVGPPVPAVRSKGERSTVTRPAPNPSLPISPDGAKQAQHEMPKQQHKKKAAPLKELPLNLARFGKGPVIRRPATCPPLFKPAEGRPPLPPPPPPSAQKTNAAAAVSGQFFSQEKGLISFLSAGGMTGKVAAAGSGVLQAVACPMSTGQTMAAPVRHVAPVAGRGPSPQVGSALGWAFSQLRQQR